ncbi:hypothetical protein BVRB_7g174070 [Beta vulgaris subsp. vulgaris]|nr:hypothetical protein BVRB_7g174070 [Beta vulgaris subsp. vulgaris]
MVFSSVLLYLDPPHWQQQTNHQQGVQGVGGRGNDHNNPNQHLIPPPPLPQPPESQVVMGGGGGDGGPGAQPIHHNLTAERARLAKILPPVAPLKCPRCESTITKFCYYNNYNLSQPRHFCKSCRRYWTQGGALRNVPVGGGCRRSTKRSSSKSSSGGGGGNGNGFSSKSPPTAMVGGDRTRMPLHMDLLSSSGTNPTISGIPSAGGGTGMSPFMASLQNIAQLGMGNLGLSFGGSPNTPPQHHPLGRVISGEDGNDLHHQLDFPHQLNPNSNNQQMRYYNTFLEGFDQIPSSSVGAGLYNSSFQQHHHQQQQKIDDDHHDHDDHISSMNSQFEPVKMEVIGQEGLNISKQFMASMTSSDNNAMGNRFWDNSIGNDTNIAGSSSMWTHLSGLNNSSSTSRLL